jgi:maestro heat-like repeat-containing protein family member 1
MSKTLQSPVIETGRNIDGNIKTFNLLQDIVKGLIVAINDPEKNIQEEIHESLCKIGKQEPLMVLSKTLGFLNSTSRSNKEHRILLMNALTEIINKNDFKWTKEIGEALIVMSCQEMIAESSIDHTWQESSSKLLISMARIAPKKVANELLEYLPSNTPPHYFVIKTLGDFAYSYRKKYFKF